MLSPKQTTRTDSSPASSDLTTPPSSTGWLSVIGATTSAALEHLEILDFELERQTATAGEDPWSKPWETLDIKFAQQILEEVDGFDDEPLDMSVFDTVITMPLPMRMFG